MSNISIPYISLNPAYICTYNRREHQATRTKREIDNQKNLQNNNTNGEISRKAKRRIEKAINWLLYVTKDKLLYPNSNRSRFTFKIAFVTLTLSDKQRHSDNWIKKEMLQRFLNVARKKWNINRYLWRAEPQKNGNIHFHIIIDQYVPWNEIRNEWNRIQSELGYMDNYRKEFGYKQANSTDIHSVYKIKNVARYLAKYCTKESKVRKIKGKQWGLSYSLSRLKNASEMIDNKLSMELAKIWEGFKEKVIKKEYVELCYVHINDWKNKGLILMKTIIDNYVKEVQLNSS